MIHPFYTTASLLDHFLLILAGQPMGDGLGLNRGDNNMIAVDDDHRPSAATVCRVDQHAAFPRLLDDPLDGRGIRADDGNDAVGGHDIAETDIDQFDTQGTLPPRFDPWLKIRAEGQTAASSGKSFAAQ